MSTYEILIEKGRKQGLEQGMEKGLEQGLINTVKNCFHKGFDPVLTSEISELSIEKVNSIFKSLEQNNKTIIT